MLASQMINPEYTLVRRIAIAASVTLWFARHFISNCAATLLTIKDKESLKSLAKPIST